MDSERLKKRWASVESERLRALVESGWRVSVESERLRALVESERLRKKPRCKGALVESALVQSERLRTRWIPRQGSVGGKEQDEGAAEVGRSKRRAGSVEVGPVVRPVVRPVVQPVVGARLIPWQGQVPHAVQRLLSRGRVKLRMQFSACLPVAGSGCAHCSAPAFRI